MILYYYVGLQRVSVERGQRRDSPPNGTRRRGSRVRVFATLDQRRKYFGRWKFTRSGGNVIHIRISVLRKFLLHFRIFNLLRFSRY